MEVFIPGDKIEAADTPKKCFMVTVPITDSKSVLRYAKINSVKVHLWNRGPADLYFEALQPFGAHSDASKIVAWSPVKGAKSKPQVKWTLKANKSGGFFRLDVSDNSLTVPAIQKVTKDKIDYLHMMLFCFSVVRNKVSFTGSADPASSRSLTFKVVIDYVGPDVVTPSACIGSGDYSEMGKVEPFPIKTANDVFSQMGLIPLGTLIGETSIQFEMYKVAQQKELGWYCDTESGKVELSDKQVLYYLRVPDAIGRKLTQYRNIVEVGFPISPVTGLVWRTDDKSLKENIVGTGVGSLLVWYDVFPSWQKPRGEGSSGWYVAQLYHNVGSFNYAPIVHLDPSSDRDVLNSFLKYQFASSNRLCLLDRFVPYKDGLHLSRDMFLGNLQKGQNRQIILRSKGYDDMKLSFTFTGFVSLVTVIIKVVEAAYAAYEKYAPTNMGVFIDDIMPVEDENQHKDFAVDWENIEV